MTFEYENLLLKKSPQNNVESNIAITEEKQSKSDISYRTLRVKVIDLTDEPVVQCDVLAVKYFTRPRKVDYLFCVSAHPKNMDAFGWFINTLAHLFNYFKFFPGSNFKHQKIVGLSKIEMFPTSVFCQCVKLNFRWTNRDSFSSCFFKN